MPRSPSDLSTTSHALLGLLALQPWTTYELAQQVRRSLNWFWPRAERKLYEEPKRLVAAGLATAREEHTGRRKRTIYQITAAGRRALATWLGEPSAPPITENEALVRVFFADAGDLSALRSTLEGLEQGARARLAELAAMASGERAFPQRIHLNAITMRLAHDQEAAVARWAQWARAQVAKWEAADDPGDWDAAAVLAELAHIPADLATPER
jgi:DNA-binding PadR family transcriptional regulator